MTHRKVRGSFLVYHGPSRINHASIIAVVTGLRRCRNPKTGKMLQLWILLAALHPQEAARRGLDAAVCGGCRHRRTCQGTCYVRLGQGPANIWKAFRRGAYHTVSLAEASELCAGRQVRLGAYGDPAALPPAVLDALVVNAAGYTGYTHQWKAARLADTTRYCQASVDSIAEYREARALGFSTFRVKSFADATLLPSEIACPASSERGHRTTCSNCGLCRGAGFHVAIQAHGIRKRLIIEGGTDASSNIPDRGEQSDNPRGRETSQNRAAQYA